MAVLYNKRFKLLIDRKMTNTQLMKKAGFSANIITRLKESLERICVTLNCGVDDILEFVPSSGD